VSTSVQAILESFDTLSAAEQQEAVVEILRRVASAEGDLPERALLETADELFRALDAEEAANANS
jgi:hypothetical protein